MFFLYLLGAYVVSGAIGYLLYWLIGDVTLTTIMVITFTALVALYINTKSIVLMRKMRDFKGE